MNNQKFCVGDVVELVSGGPDMTVYHVPENIVDNQYQVKCMWFDTYKALECAEFPSSVLIKKSGAYTTADALKGA